MSKRNVIIAIIITVIVGVGAGVLVFSLQKTKNQNEVNAPLVNSGNFLDNLSPETEEVIAYEDESGFSFSYPKSIEIEDITPNDDSYYTELKLTKSGKELMITIKDGNTNPYKTDKSAKLTGSTSLGGVASSQYEVDGKLVSIAIDQGVIYIISGPKDSGFWEDAQTKIVSSFKFAGQSGNTTATDGNTVYEEEVVE